MNKTFESMFHLNDLLTLLIAAFGKADLRYISYLFNCSSEKLDTNTLKMKIKQDLIIVTVKFNCLITALIKVKKILTASFLAFLPPTVLWIYHCLPHFLHQAVHS